MSDIEHGIRVFLDDGKYEDYDPIEDGDYTIDGRHISIKDTWSHDNVDRVVPYPITYDEQDGWFRFFDDEKDMREKTDRLREF